MTAQQPGDVTSREAPSPYGPPSPLEDVAQNLRGPASRGFVLGLVLLVLVALFWVDHRQATRLEQLDLNVSSVSTSVGGGTGTVPDPQTCWLLGVVANGQGKGDVVARMDASSASMSDCQMYAARGARGQDLDGN